MVSPISEFIAEAVLQQLESLVFRHRRPKFWTRYVGDTFVLIDRDLLLTFNENLNALFPDIEFTMEVGEENNQLVFLDVLVCREDCDGLKTIVFMKATDTMQVVGFSSNHPISHKRSCEMTLYRHVEMHCSVTEDKIAEVQYLRRIFKVNGYPHSLVIQCICKRNEISKIQILVSASVYQEVFGHCQTPSRTTWDWSCTRTGGNHQASGNETERLAAAVRNVWSRF
ncbi:hypothetical protein SprV_0602228200 [Sparganum proliferum]